MHIHSSLLVDDQPVIPLCFQRPFSLIDDLGNTSLINNPKKRLGSPHKKSSNFGKVSAMRPCGGISVVNCTKKWASSKTPI